MVTAASSGAAPRHGEAVHVAAAVIVTLHVDSVPVGHSPCLPVPFHIFPGMPRARVAWVTVDAPGDWKWNAGNAKQVAQVVIALRDGPVAAETTTLPPTACDIFDIHARQVRVCP
eukprot:CAMPEP_0168411302 /NCGR_PEP_ID=MMETSP0228-20121227/28132_1 /TAXON_ID=133427 /ORGANISM="Protoceratium reticulatum, Strain CCCM 535 (=CCMP 1889)" /LENGTH=114 /DNA_ID=CAMNT_0008425047 /DNA_START=111 /DNA_END=455 /DNA_ORIENTATION=-